MSDERDGKIRIGLDARIVPGRWGGVEQVVLGMASALSRLSDGDEEYVFCTYSGNKEWLSKYCSGSCRVLEVQPFESMNERPRGFIKRIQRQVQILHRRRFGHLPHEPKVIVSEAFDVFHFLKQWGFRTRTPNIYHPHDLQHVHLPSLFEPATIQTRERMYRLMANQATLVATCSTWIKQDVERQYGLDPSRVKAVPLAPVTEFEERPSEHVIRSTKKTLNLPNRFIFYPAQLWLHKNHANLIRATAEAQKACESRIHLVFSGRLNEPVYSELLGLTGSLGLEGQVHFLGFVEQAQMKSLYFLAHAVVIPTLYEAASFPLWEAFEAGVPAACSNVTSLPRQAGEAALIFDPHDIEDMARSLVTIWTNEEVRGRLIELGKARIELFTWDRTAKHFRALYRLLAGRGLSAEDRELIDQEARL
ncbi:glycosyltransferase family 4 protein [bacterium]|nr:glycosyltransferase family 4 protein [bacterium]